MGRTRGLAGGDTAHDNEGDNDDQEKDADKNSKNDDEAIDNEILQDPSPLNIS